MSGQKYNRLKIIGLQGVKRMPCGTNKYMWKCVCDCGSDFITEGGAMRNGRTKSCGCWQKEQAGKRGKEMWTTHGLSLKAEHRRTRNSWVCMLNRCYYELNKDYHNYGGRGIIVCDQWKEYPQFLKDMGIRPEGKTLDRKNPEGNYEPDNCRWATSKEQHENKRVKAK